MKIESHTQTISLSIHVFELEIPIDEFALSNPNGSTLPPSPNPPFLKDTLKTARKKKADQEVLLPKSSRAILLVCYLERNLSHGSAAGEKRRKATPLFPFHDSRVVSHFRRDGGSFAQ